MHLCFLCKKKPAFAFKLCEQCVDRQAERAFLRARLECEPDQEELKAR